MPYNVLCLVSTVIAMCIGAIHNLTTSQLVDSSVAKVSPSVRPSVLVVRRALIYFFQPDTNLGKAIHFIKSILIAVKTKFSKSKPDEPEVQAETQPEVRPEVEDEANEAIRQRINSSKAE